MSKAFSTDKHGYRTRDVDLYVAEANRAALEQKQRIAELKKEVAEKDAELKAFKQKQDLIVKSIVSAVQKAEQIEGLIKQKYAGEIAHLNAFHEQWLGYYNKLIEAYPLSDELGAINQFNRKVSAILMGDTAPERKFEDAKRQFESETARLNKSGFGAKNQYESENNRLNKNGGFGGSNSGYNGGSKNVLGGDLHAKTAPNAQNSGGKKYVGFIPVSDENLEGLDDELDFMSEFNPEESIRQMFRREVAEEERKAAKTAAKASQKQPQKPASNQKNTQKSAQNTARNLPNNTSTNAKKSPVAATLNPADLGVSDSGFSFEEALNPTQQLSDILKEIGLSLDEK